MDGKKLAEVLQLARERGLGGFCVINQGGGKDPYLAACLTFDGQISDPRTWCTYATPEGAIEGLHRLLTNLKAEALATQGV
jgi:hypothetical protein